MANTKGESSIRSMMYNARNPLLPPKCPFSNIPPSYADYIPTSAIAPNTLPKPREGYNHHRTSSESFLIEEQPSWLDELLNEPETPVRKSHRRSSSDSFACFEGNMNYIAQNASKFKRLIPVHAWGSGEFDVYRDIQHSSFYASANPSSKTKNRVASPTDNTVISNGGLLIASEDADKYPSSSTENKETSQTKYPETDTKHAKQQFAQRSRVRKLQYIAELERSVQALLAEGSGVSAELEFINQQNIILSMENKALKQRLENLSQEQLIKCLEHEVLEREVGRLQNLYKHQQQTQPKQQQHMSPSHHRRRANSRDLDHQFATLSLQPN